jgi:hypothetical protein
VSGASGGAASARSKAASAVSAGAMAARDRLLQLAASLTPERRLDLEAERARLMHMLLDPATAASAAAELSTAVASARAANAAAVAALAPPPLQAAPSAATLGAQPSAGTVGTAVTRGGRTAASAAARRAPPAPKLPELASAHYVLDFGFATKGVNKSRKVKFTNTSMQQVRRRRGRSLPC